MTAKEYLNQYRWLNSDINSKLEQIERLRELATAISPATGFGGSGEISDKVGRTVAKLVDAENEINRKIDEFVDLKTEIENTIDKVPDETLRKLLKLRYIDLKTWEQIAVEIGYSYRNTTRLHGKALNVIRKLVLECPN